MIKDISNLTEITSLASQKPVVVVFHAPWCGTCSMYHFTLTKFDMQDPSVVILKVNLADHQEIGNHFKVLSTPSVMIYHSESNYTLLPGPQPIGIIKRYL
jgi:thioredoxin-like negative regulator of GroEL